MYKSIYPWQIALWQHLQANKARLPHALLLHGRAGIGKYDFAWQLSQALLCTNVSDEGEACRHCASCHWFNEESHPDFKRLSPEQDDEIVEEKTRTKKIRKKSQITVAQVRELDNFLSLTSHLNKGLRIVFIHPAEAMNISAGNAILKMLEEPANGVVFILVAEHLQRLLPTITSRCQKIIMPVPDKPVALAWLLEQGVNNAEQQLAYLDGSPIKVMSEQLQLGQLTEIWGLLALGNKVEPHRLAPILIAHSVEAGIIALQKWIYDIVVMHLTHNVHYHLAYKKAFQTLAAKVNLYKLFELQKKIAVSRKLALHPLNHELQMENLLLDYTRIFTPA